MELELGCPTVAQEVGVELIERLETEGVEMIKELLPDLSDEMIVRIVPSGQWEGAALPWNRKRWMLFLVSPCRTMSKLRHQRSGAPVLRARHGPERFAADRELVLNDATLWFPGSGSKEGEGALPERHPRDSQE